MQVPGGMIGSVSKTIWKLWTKAVLADHSWSLPVIPRMLIDEHMLMSPKSGLSQVWFSDVFCTTCGNRLWNPAAVPAAISVLGHKTSIDVVGEPNPAAKKLLDKRANYWSVSKGRSTKDSPWHWNQPKVQAAAAANAVSSAGLVNNSLHLCHPLPA